MSQENVELIRRATEAFNRGDYESFLADVAPEFEYVASGVIPGGGGVYRGSEEMVSFVEAIWGEFDNVRSEVHETVEAGDQAVISLTIEARGKRSGAETTWSFAQLLTFRDGKVIRAQGFPTRKDALEAVGLSE